MKKFFFLILIAVSMANNLMAMKESENIVKSQSLMGSLPRELVEKILTLVGFNNATSFEQVLDNIKKLEESPMFSSFIKSKPFIVNLAKLYVEKSPDLAYNEFSNALVENKIPIIKIFANTSMLNPTDQNKKPPLMIAVRKFIYEKDKELIRKNNGVVKLLIDAGADVNYKDKLGTTFNGCCH